MIAYKKGSSVPFSFDLDGDSLSGWVCTINVAKHIGDTAEISRVITASDDSFSGHLTSTETTALASLGTYALTAVIANSTDDKEVVKVQRFHLSEAL